MRFLKTVVFMNKLPVGSRLTPHKTFEFGRNFVEIFVKFDSLSGVWYKEREKMVLGCNSMFFYTKIHKPRHLIITDDWIYELNFMFPMFFKCFTNFFSHFLHLKTLFRKSVHFSLMAPRKWRLSGEWYKVCLCIVTVLLQDLWLITFCVPYPGIVYSYMENKSKFTNISAKLRQNRIIYVVKLGHDLLIHEKYRVKNLMLKSL